MDCVRFARYCGQMYRRHLFSYGGLRKTRLGGIETLLRPHAPLGAIRTNDDGINHVNDKKQI